MSGFRKYIFCLESSARTSSIKPSRSFNGPNGLCLDLEKYILSFEKFSSHWKSICTAWPKVFFSLKKCLHSLTKTLPRFSRNQKLSQCPGLRLIAIYKSLLFCVCRQLNPHKIFDADRMQSLTNSCIQMQMKPFTYTQRRHIGTTRSLVYDQ